MVEQLRKPLFRLFEFFVSQIVLVTRRFVLVDEGGRWKSEIEVVHYGSTRVKKITQKSLACGSFCRCVTFSLHISSMHYCLDRAIAFIEKKPLFS